MRIVADLKQLDRATPSKGACVHSLCVARNSEGPSPFISILNIENRCPASMLQFAYRTRALARDAVRNALVAPTGSALV